MENLKLSYAHNTRDLGNMMTSEGKVIKENMLIRSGKLKKLTDEDIQILKEHHLKNVIDFRSEDEFIHLPDVRIEGVSYYNFPAIKQNMKECKGKEDSNLLMLVNPATGGFHFMINTYHQLLTSKEGIQAYQNFFKVLQESEGATLWHCSQGKDRAGLAAFLIEYALGVPIDICIDDYLYTNIAMEEKIEQLTPVLLKESDNNYDLLPILREVFEAKEEYITESIKVILENYESIDNFIINVLHADIAKLKEKYLI